MFGAPLQNTYNIFGTEQFKHTYPRYPNTLSLAYGVRWYGCLERQPGTQTLFLALRTSNTTVIGMQKHLRWPMVYSGMGVWGATPEPKQIFLALCISTTTVLGIQKHLDWPTGYSRRGVWSAIPEPKHYFLALCISNTTALGIQIHLCWSMGIMVWVFGAPLQNQTMFFGIVQFKRHRPRYPKTPLLAYGLRW